MPDASHMLAFILAALVLAVIPGPGLLYVLARSLGGGREVGLRSSFGTGVGGLVHVAAAAAGLSALLAASASTFAVVRYLGAAYLIWLGIRMIRSGRDDESWAGSGRSRSDARAFRQGVVTEALNPKTALFFVSFLPQFVQPQAGPLAAQLAVLGVISVMLNTSADVLVAWSAGKLGQRLAADRRWWQRQRRLSGGLLVGLGVYAAASDRA
jgi:threonine/homoserine/homoserine lactone efflux protein